MSYTTISEDDKLDIFCLILIFSEIQESHGWEKTRFREGKKGVRNW